MVSATMYCMCSKPPYHSIHSVVPTSAYCDMQRPRPSLASFFCVVRFCLLLQNLSTSLSLVNGSRGIVVDFVDYPTPQQQTEQDEGAKGGTRKTVQYWPLVQFAEGGEPRVMGPEMWKVEKHGHEIASRTQVPLTLAWALSVHKCQGMTLDRVDTNLSRAFDYGMVYVALSRVRKLEGLHLSGFDPKKIRVHGKVVAFYDDLQRPGSAKLDSIAFEKEDEGEEDWH